MSSRWPFVAREAETDLAVAALTAGGSVVVYGDGGGGKSRLAAEVLDRLQRQGFEVARVGATEASRTIPLGALAPLLPALGPGEANALAAARAAIADRAGGGRLALLVDDAHLLDDPSATMVLQIAVQRLASVVLTVHRWRPVPDAVTALWKEGVAERIDLAPLGLDQIAAAVQARLGGPVEPAVVEQLHRFAEGLPLALTELVEGSLSSGVLHELDGRWVLDDLPLPSVRLVDLVERRIDLLDDAGRRGLELLAFGEPLDLDVFEALVGPDVADTLEWRSFAAVRDDSGRPQVWLAHPLHGAVVRSQAGALRRRNVYTALADAVDAAGPAAPSDRARVALWRLESGRDAGTAGLVAAARQATIAHDLAAVERLAGEAWRRDADVEAGYLLGCALLRRGDPATAGAVLAAAEAGAPPAWRAELAAAHAEALYRQGLAADAIARCEATEPTVGAVGAARLRALRGFYVLGTGDALAALDAVEPLLTSGDDDALAAAAPTALPALVAVGRAEDALGLAERAIAAHRAAWAKGLAVLDPETTVLSSVAALVSAGRLDEAEPLALEGHRRADALQQPHAAGVCAGLLGTVALRRGQVSAAAAWLARSARLLRDVDASGRVGLALSMLALAEVSAGQVEAAARTLDEARELSVEGVWTAGYREADALVRARRGDRQGALEGLAASAHDAADHHQHELAVQRAHTLALLGAPEVALVVVEPLRDAISNDLLATLVQIVDALAARDGAALAAAARHLEDLGQLAWAADAAAAAADAYGAAGNSRAATAATQQALGLVGRCEAYAPPWLPEVTPAEPLSRRERDVAELAAAGLANSDIATRLYLSTRTVENHLYRVYTKLGVSSRAELAERLGPPPA